MSESPKRPSGQVNVEEIIKSYKVTNIKTFTSYLTEIWFDLAHRSVQKKKGVDKLTFSSYYKLPGILSDRLFAVFDRNKKGYIDLDSFIFGMKTLFADVFDNTARLIFDFYDFDKDGKISQEDIRTVLSYVTLHNDNTLLSARKYIDRVQSQEELHQILNSIFSNFPQQYMIFDEFIKAIEAINSDIYFFILLFLYENKPFSKMALGEYEKQKKIENVIIKSPPKFVRRPTKHSTFSSCITFLRSPTRKKTVEEKQMMEPMFVKRNQKKTKTTQMVQMTGINFLREQKEKRALISQSITEENINQQVVDRKANVNIKEMPFKKLSSIKNNDKYADVKIKPAFKQDSLKKKPLINIKTKNTKLKLKPSEDMSKNKDKKDNELNTNIKDKQEDSILQLKPIDNNVSPLPSSLKLKINTTNNTDNTTHQLVFSSDEEEEEENEEEEEEEIVKYEGFLYKFVDSQMKKLWFKLVHNDLYFFKNNKDKQHKGMHNLSGVFFQEEEPYAYHNKTFYAFSLSFAKKLRKYYCDDLSQYKLWIENIKSATGYTNLDDIYEIGEKIGSGRFGLIKLGINKRTRKKFAIKIMSKMDMESSDIELVRTEIEILKICQHPNIIQIYDVFENVDSFYIIMEYCSGGDLFSYLEKRGFRLSETRACEIMHKMCTAVFYIHSYGIIHRDLKPENVLMTNDSDHSDIRILDFGLSKILGPDETSTEPYGTLCYCAPEVLKEEPYNKAIDLWSIGIITYLLLSGSLPFDHKTDDKEVIRQTIYDQLIYKGKVWNIISDEAKDFIESKHIDWY